MIPFLDLRAQYRQIKPEIDAAIARVVDSAQFILGPEVAAFEERFAAYCGVKYCVALNSGTSALHLALLAAGIGAGDEVITVSMTFVATTAAILYCGAKPVFVDIDPDSWTMDANLIEAAVTPRTKAILPVHLHGLVADMDPILAIARRHGLAVIEDAAQSHGAGYKGRNAGSIGDIGCFSFYPGKNLGAYGEGGALTTNDDEVAKMARSLRSHGESKRYLHKYVGYNYRMEGIQAAVLNVKVKYLEQWTAKRQACAETYRQLLAGAKVRLLEDSPDAECIYHLFVAYVEDRDQVRAELEDLGVQTAVHYPVPVHMQEAFSYLGTSPTSLPFTKRACEQVLSMPLFPEMTEEQVAYAAHTLVEVVARH